MRLIVSIRQKTPLIPPNVDAAGTAVHPTSLGSPRTGHH
jgi:hypothetical protein